MWYLFALVGDLFTIVVGILLSLGCVIGILYVIPNKIRGRIVGDRMNHRFHKLIHVLGHEFNLVPVRLFPLCLDLTICLGLYFFYGWLIIYRYENPQEWLSTQFKTDQQWCKNYQTTVGFPVFSQVGREVVYVDLNGELQEVTLVTPPQKKMVYRVEPEALGVHSEFTYIHGEDLRRPTIVTYKIN